MELDAKVWWAWDAIAYITAEFFPKRTQGRGVYFGGCGFWLLMAVLYFVFIVVRAFVYAALCVAFVLLNCVSAGLYWIFTGVFWLVWRSWH